MTPITEGTCERCQQTRPLFDRLAQGEPKKLCAPCWSRVQEARDNGTFVGWNDAFDNATDEQLLAYLNGSTR